MLYKRGRYYWARFKWQGKIIDKSSRATDKKTARNIEAKIRSELAQENFGILQPKEVPTLGKFLKEDFLPFTASRFKDVPKSAVYYAQGREAIASLRFSQASIRRDHESRSLTVCG
jgi:hypothetical protein